MYHAKNKSQNKEGGEIVFVKPYLNLQTFTMTMSVSRLLYDGESVISMDIFLDGVQDMVRKMGTSDQVDAALVMDKSGFIVTHSNQNEIVNDYLKDSSTYKEYLAKKILEKNESVFYHKG